MKKITPYLLGAIAVLLSSFSYSQLHQEDYYLKGKIKSVQSSTFKVSATDTIKFLEPLDQNDDYFFDEIGRLQRKIGRTFCVTSLEHLYHWHNDSTVIEQIFKGCSKSASQIIYRLKKRNVIEIYVPDKSIQLLKPIKEKYLKNSLMTLKTYNNKNKVLRSITYEVIRGDTLRNSNTIYFYDKFGNNIKTIFQHNLDKNWRIISNSIFDLNGQTIEKIDSIPKNKVSNGSLTKRTFNYDTTGSLLSYTKNSNGKLTRHSFTYIFDNEGNWTTKNIYKKEGEFVIFRKIEYYPTKK